MAPPRPCLPTDCLFHVFLRLNPVSIVRCAAVSRHWRRAVTDNTSEIRRHPTGRADRCLLLGLHHREMYPGELLYAPLACGDGLLLLCRGLPAEISVVNPFTGFHTTIARPGGLVPYRYVLHFCMAPSPTLSRITRLPKQCSMRNEDVSDKKMLMLATSEDDRLSLLRREEASLEVSVWLYVGDHGSGGDPENSWLLRQSIGIRKLIEDAGLSRFQTRLERFCPRSRSVILWIPYLGLLVLDPEGKRIQRAADDCHGHIWPYEIDLTLCLCSMKTF
ncbi:hypothetical protein GQ55_9G119000 [Panicum hallii var. hallii]|uniref:F-box domain-containing protein n=1 Tax=Panicum hallii var. hallii TaxID=1504633 RepID=A0A2T7C259_9POAL|nr:hypothetical protein GQ55_9G119000 [Panicum hallii var. hallii]